MDKFESQFEDVDVQTQYLETTVDSMSATTTPSDEVSRLLRQVADAHQLQLSEGMTAAPTGLSHATGSAAIGLKGESLDERLAKLRSIN